MRLNYALLWKAFLVGAQVVAGGLVTLDVTSVKVVGLVVLAVAAAQGATTFYDHGVASTAPDVPADGTPSAGG